MIACHKSNDGWNYAPRVVTRLGRSEHIPPVLHDLHWLPVDMRIVYIGFLYYMNVLLRIHTARRPL